MTREEQIYSQSISYTRNIFREIEDFSDVVYAFADGVRWADENPQFSKEEFIEKACEWLESVLKSDLGYYSAAEFADTFRKVMEE